MVTEAGAFNPRFFGKRINAFGGTALVIDGMIQSGVPINLMAKPCPNTGGNPVGAAALCPPSVLDRTSSTLLPSERTDVVGAFVFDGSATTNEGILQGHNKIALTVGMSLVIEGLVALVASGKRHGSKPVLPVMPRLLRPLRLMVSGRCKRVSSGKTNPVYRSMVHVVFEKLAIVNDLASSMECGAMSFLWSVVVQLSGYELYDYSR